MEAGKYKNYRWDVDREKLIKIAQGFPSHSCNNYMERKGNSALFMLENTSLKSMKRRFAQINEKMSAQINERERLSKSMKKPLVKSMKHPSSAKTRKVRRWRRQ